MKLIAFVAALLAIAAPVQSRACGNPNLPLASIPTAGSTVAFASRAGEEPAILSPYQYFAACTDHMTQANPAWHDDQVTHYCNAATEKRNFALGETERR